MSNGPMALVAAVCTVPKRGTMTEGEILSATETCNVWEYEVSYAIRIAPVKNSIICVHLVRINDSN